MILYRRNYKGLCESDIKEILHFEDIIKSYFKLIRIQNGNKKDSMATK
jgi:hypothetical protein